MRVGVYMYLSSVCDAEPNISLFPLRLWKWLFRVWSGPLDLFPGEFGAVPWTSSFESFKRPFGPRDEATDSNLGGGRLRVYTLSTYLLAGIDTRPSPSGEVKVQFGEPKSVSTSNIWFLETNYSFLIRFVCNKASRNQYCLVGHRWKTWVIGK